MNPQEFEKWKDNEVDKTYPLQRIWNHKEKAEIWNHGADAAYNLLSKEIENANAKSEGNEIIAIERGKAIEELQKENETLKEEVNEYSRNLKNSNEYFQKQIYELSKEISEKDEEIENMKKHIQALELKLKLQTR